MKLHRIKLSSSNAYFLEGERNYLIDCGSQNDFPHLVYWFSKQKIALNHINWVILTHGHSDHAGTAAALQRVYGLRVALHSGDIDLVRTGSNGPLTPTSFAAKILKPIVDQRFPPFEPDLIFSTPADFLKTEFPIAFTLTTGHTDGSVSFVDANFAIVGDILRGSPIFPNKAAYHFFIEDRQKINHSIQKILRMKPKIIYPGHFGPVSLSNALQAFQK